MFSENLSTTLEKLKGVVSEKGLLIFACVSLAFLFLFVVLTLAVKGKFSKRCQDLQKFIESNNISPKNVNALEGI